MLQKVIMDLNEMEMSEEELQTWIREKIRNKLISSNMLGACKLLQSLLEKRKKRAEQLLKLCESVSACEAIVEKQYSLLGWKYRDTDHDDDDNITGCGSTVSRSTTTNSPTLELQKLQGSKNFRRVNYKDICLKRKPVVVLTRLSKSEISFFQSLTPKDPSSDIDSLSGLNIKLEPEYNLIDSDYSISSSSTGSNKRRRIDHNNKTLAEGEATPKAKRKSDTESKVIQTTTPQASATTDAQSKVPKSSSPKGSATTDSLSKVPKSLSPKGSATADSLSKVPKSLSPKGSATTDAQSNIRKTLSPKGSANNDTPIETATADAKSNPPKTSPCQTSASSVGQSNATNKSTPQTSASSTAQRIVIQPASASAVKSKVRLICKNQHQKTPSTVQNTEISINMNVLARRRPMSWQHGKITDIVTKEDGKLKYKVTFEDKGKSLIRAHHMAFEYKPKLEQLEVGCRVVVQPDPAKSKFCPGILGELPNRKNRMRFLVFMDDHSPIYVGLLLLNLVCKPLKDPLDDVPEGHHKDFLRKYLNAWPYQPQTQYRVGQSLNAEVNGVMQRFEVQDVDSSLMQIVSADQQKMWIYRGSTFLEHMNNMKGFGEEKTKEKEKTEENKQK